MFITKILSLTYTTIMGKEFKLLQPVKYQWCGHLIEVPAGFVTDLASIPQVFQSIIPKVGEHMMAAVVHDWLYANKGWLPSQEWHYTRKDADEIFLEAMKLAGVGYAKRYAMYWAVRAAGWVLWNRGK